MRSADQLASGLPALSYHPFGSSPVADGSFSLLSRIVLRGIDISSNGLAVAIISNGCRVELPGCEPALTTYGCTHFEPQREPWKSPGATRVSGSLPEAQTRQEKSLMIRWPVSFF